jgi:hypothetical protein
LIADDRRTSDVTTGRTVPGSNAANACRADLGLRDCARSGTAVGTAVGTGAATVRVSGGVAADASGSAHVWLANARESNAADAARTVKRTKKSPTDQ